MNNSIKRFLIAVVALLAIVPAVGAQTVDWARQFGTAGTDEGNGITSDGSYVYVTGTAGGTYGALGHQYTWTTTPSGTSNQLNAAAYADMDTVVAVGDLGTMVRSTDGGSTWQEIVSVTGDFLYGIDFFSVTNGLAVGFGTVLTSVDGGATWSIPLSGAPFVLYDVDFISASEAVAVGSGGTVIRTTDGGDNWGAVTSNTIETLRAVHFSTATNGVAVGENGAIIRTTDGGLTWASVASGVTAELRDVDFGDSNNGFAVGSSGTILRTSDGGGSWSPESSAHIGLFTGVFQVGGGRAMAVGEDGTVWRTWDLGATWYLQTSGDLLAQAVAFKTTQHAVIVGGGGSTLQSVPQGLPNSAQDIFLSKYDLAGNLLWKTQIGSGANDAGHGVATDGTLVYVCGEASAAFPGQSHGGDRDGVLACFTAADGILMWVTQFGGSSTDLALGVAISDAVYVAGMDSGADVLLRKYTSAGQLMWSNSFSSPGFAFDYAHGISAGVPGLLYVTGQTDGTFSGQTASGGTDFFVRCIDDAGNEVWTAQGGTGGYDICRGSYADGSGVYVAGIVSGSFDGNPYAGGWDCFVAKYDNTGTLVWSDEVGSGGNDIAEGVSGSGTDVTVVGTANGALPGQTGLGGNDPFARRYTSAGTALWTNQYGSNFNDTGKGVVRVGDEDYIAGSTTGTLAGQSSAGGSDAFALKVLQDPVVAGVVYVDADAVGADNGSSWGDAYVDLQSALAAAIPGDSIWVAEGTYRPTAGNDRNATFTMVAGVAIYGGFAATENVLSQRDPDAYVTILSGDVGALAETGDNSYHVVSAGTGVGADAVLDGFTVFAGNALGVNDGGGVWLIDASPTIRNCKFYGNTAQRGGAMHIYLGGPTVENCVFGGPAPGQGNAALAGGAVFNDGATPTFTGCTFEGNEALPGNGNGGATDNAFGSNVTYDNCTFTGNSGTRGGAMNAYDSEVTITNSQFYNNESSAYGGGVMIQWSGAAAAAASGLAATNPGGRLLASPGTPERDAGPRAASAAIGDVTIVGCDFEGNDALADGGGILFLGMSGNIVNSRFYNNQSQGDTLSGGVSPFGGGGIATYQGTLTVTNCTLASNDAWGIDPSDGGGGIFAYFADISVENSILWGNNAPAAASVEEEQILAVGSGLVSVINSVVQGLPAYGASNNTGLDPKLSSWQEGGDLTIGLTSSAINRGNNALIGETLDFDGNPRVSAGTVDAGAYEYQADCPAVSRLYVDAGATGGNGDTWITAFNNLQDALATARICGGVSEIWVAAGTYVPTDDYFDRTASFRLIDQVAVYGGFSAGDTDLSQRDFIANETILSGNIGASADSTDNSYHVVAVGSGVDPGTLLDGFTITGGYANGGGEDDNGAGVNNMASSGFGAADFANLIIRNNHASWLGGGVGNDGPGTYTNVIFERNTSVSDGAGLWQGNNNTVIFRNCAFIENSSGLYGGGIRTGGPCEFTNVVFYGNSAGTGGGGMENFGDAVLTNVTFAGNSAGSFGGGAIRSGDGRTPTFINAVIWGNSATALGSNVENIGGAVPTFSYCLLEGSNGSGVGWTDYYGTDGGNNIDADPLFVDIINGDLRLLDASPAANSGNNAAPNLLATDLDGNSRIIGGTVDMGAYESSALADSDGDGIIDIVDACPSEDARGFDRNLDGCIDEGAGGRHVEYWGEPDTLVTYVINENGVPGAGVSAIPAIQAAFDSWNAIPGIVQQAVYGGTTTQVIADPLDGISLVTGGDTDYAFGSATLAVGLTTSFTVDSLFMGRTYRAGEIVDADMLFNPAKVYTTTGGAGSDVQAVATHEAGHIFGISHTAVITSTMFYVLPPGLNARTLEEDDVIALTKAYPSDATLATGNRIEGNVYDGVGDPTPGAIVFAIDAATGDTTACEYTLPDGRYSFIGLPDGNYFVSIHPINGSSAIGYLIPERINALISATANRVFQPEYYDAAESNIEADPLARIALNVSGGTQLANIDVVLNEDATPPVVTNVAPADGATGVPVANAVLISFSEPIDSGTLSGNFALVDSVTQIGLGGNAAILNDDSLVSFTPTGGLQYNTTYELKLETGLSDLAGNGLATQFVSRFRTEGVPPYGLTGLVPDKGVKGAAVVITGNDFSSNPADLTVTFNGVEATILSASTTELVVVVPPGASSGNVVVTKTSAGATNGKNFVVLPPAETFSAVEAGAVALGSLPRAVDSTPSGAYAYVATEDGAVAVDSDPGSGNFLSTTPMPIAGGLRDIAVRPDGRRAYGVSFDGRSISVIDTDADLASPSFNSVLSTTPMTSAPLGILAGPAGRRAYVPSDAGQIEIWDVTQAAAISQVGTIVSPDPSIRGKMAIDPIRDELLVLAGTGKVLFFNLVSNALVAEVSVGGDPRDIAIDAAAERAYVSDNNGFVTIVSLGTKFRVTPDITTGGSLRGVSLTPAGMFLFGANRLLNYIDVVDLDVGNSTFRAVVDQIPQGVNPVDVKVSPDGQYLYSLIEDTQQFVVTSINAGPSIETLSRYAGPVGASIVITGTSLTDSLVTVSFNGVPAALTSIAPTALTAVVPAGASSGAITVTTTSDIGTVAQSNEVFFEVLGPSPAGGLRLAAKVGIPATPDLTTAMAVSPTGNVMAFGGENGELWVVDTRPTSPEYNQIIGAFSPVTGSVDDVAITPDGKRALVLTGLADELVAVDINPLSPDFGTSLATVDFSSLGSHTNDRIVMSPDGTTLLVSDPASSSVHRVDIRPESATAYELTGSFFIGGGSGDVREMAFHPGGRYVYMPIRDANSQSIAIGDIQTGFVAATASLPTAIPSETPMDIAFSPDGSRAYMLTSQELGILNRSVLTLDTSVPTSPSLIIRQPFGASLGVIREHIVVSPRGDRVIFATRGELFRRADVTADSLAILEQTGDLFFHLTGVEMDYAPDGSRLYATSQNRDSVYVYDFSTAQDIAIDSGNAQTGVINQPLANPLRVFVGATGGAPVAGVAVRFDVTGGGGVFVGTGTGTRIATSDMNGIAQVQLISGPVIGASSQVVTATAPGLSGSPLQFTATTVDDPNNLPLQITSVVPVNAATNVSATTALQAKFSRPVDKASVTGSTFFLRRDSDFAVVPTVTGFSSLNKQISLTPNAPLDFNTSYSFVIGALQDTNNGPLVNAGTTTFSTSVGPPPLTLEAISPPSATTNTTVVLSGKSFAPTPSGNTVLFNNIAATPTSGSTSSLNVVVPVGATSGTVRVVAGADTSQAKPFTVIVPQTTNIDEVIATIGTGSATKGLTINPDGTIAYSVSQGTGTVIPIDIAGESTFPAISVGNSPVAITITPDGNEVYVTNLASGTVTVIDSDPLSPTFHQPIETIVVGTAPSDVVVSPDGDRVYVANGGSNEVSVIDSDQSSSAHLEVIATIGVGTGTKGLTISPDGAELYVGNDQGYTIVDPLGYEVIATIGVGTSTKGLTISPDGTLLFLLTTEGEVLIIDNEPGSVSENEVIATIGTGRDTKGLTINPDGTLLYLIQEEADIIIVLELDVADNVSVTFEEQIPGRLTVTPVDTLEVGEDPAVLVFDPSGSGLALLTSPGNDSVVFLSTEPATVVADIVVTPRTLNSKSKGRWIKGSIELPAPYVPQDIVLESVLLIGQIQADLDQWSIADADSDGIDELEVRFDRTVFQTVMPQGEYVPVTITGMVDGKQFVGNDTIRTIRPTVKKPASWAVITPGQGYTIEWDSPQGTQVDYVEVDFSSDDGESWSSIASGIPDAGSVGWQAPMIISEQCRVMVTLFRDGETIGAGMNQYPFVVSAPVSVSLANFEVGMDGSSAVMRWETNLEFGTLGYHLYRATEREGNYERVTRDMVAASGRIEGGVYEYRDLLTEGNRTYYYRLEEVSKDGEPVTFGPYAVTFKLAFALEQNVPNPFNPTTKIRFSLAERSNVRLEVYDVAGRRVTTLVNESRPANVYDISWDGMNDRGEQVASGVYFYRLVAGKFHATRKMVLLK